MTLPLSSLNANLNLMISGLKNHLLQIQKRGIDAAFIEQMHSLQQKISQTNHEQEILKGDLRKKTAELNQLVQESNLVYREAKKIVKLEIEQSLWVQFGIKDRK